MLKRSIGIGMLCVAGHAYSADINITTTEDVVKDDTECSLREAIEYLNIPADDRPEAGYMGCGGTGASTNILLEAKKEYKVKSPLYIKTALLIRTDYSTNVTDEVAEGMNNATLKMTGASNIFVIDDANNQSSALITFKELTLAGCSVQKCADKGGLIYNNERLQLNTVKLSGGWADQGGAIYNLGVNSDYPAYASTVEVLNSLFEKNKAAEGGIIYTQAPSVFISRSVFRDNETAAAASANIYAAQGLSDEKLVSFPLSMYKISNSTFFSNKGAVANVTDGMGLNNLTMVANGSGLILNAPKAKAYISNSILIGNPYPVITGGSDCRFESGDQSVLWNNLVSPVCGTGNLSYPNGIWNGTQLFAGSNVEGECASLKDDTTALLCPYRTVEKAFTGYFRPRILLSYNSIADSLIVNKGLKSNGKDAFVTCEASDQRSVNRDADPATCDRGAIEIVVPTATSLAGQDILVGDVAKISIADYLGDSDLMPKEECERLLGKNPTGAAWKDGCIQVVQRETPSKGSLTIDLQGNLVYTPNGAWRGADMFTIRVVTSSTRFNSSNKPYMEININVVQETENTMESKTVETSGGSFGFLSVFALLGLAGLRRYKKS